MSDAPLVCDAAMVGMLVTCVVLGLNHVGVIALGNVGSPIVLFINLLFATIVVITSN